MEVIFAVVDADTLTQLVANFGPLAGVVLFFIWRDWKREDTLSARVEKLETYQRETLTSLIERAITALAQNAECLKWATRSIDPPVNCYRPPVDESPKSLEG